MDTNNKQQGPRVNEAIRIREVRVVVDATNEQLGIMPTFKALELAQEQGLDLVEIAPTARPPVCKIMDYGKFKYQKAKAEQEAKKKQTTIEVKEIRLTPRIADHDLQVKAKKIQEFLAEGDKVLLTIKFKGREKAHTEQGKQVMDKMIALIPEGVNIESQSKMEDGKMSMTISGKRYNKDEPKEAQSAQSKQA